MKHPCNSKAQKHIHQKFPNFATNPRNVYLALAANGVNQFQLTISTWSTWPITLLNNNFPPWLTSEKKFIVLTLLIPVKEFVTSEHFDVYLQPLVGELQQLWTKVLAYDVVKSFGYKSFTLRGMLIWTIHNFPWYGIVARVAHQGFVTCPICGPKFKEEHLVELWKQTYIGTCRWLPKRHPYKTTRMKDHFNGHLETCPNPKIVIANEQLA